MLVRYTIQQYRTKFPSFSLLLVSVKKDDADNNYMTSKKVLDLLPLKVLELPCCTIFCLYACAYVSSLKRKRPSMAPLQIDEYHKGDIVSNCTAFGLYIHLLHSLLQCVLCTRVINIFYFAVLVPNKHHIPIMIYVIFVLKRNTKFSRSFSSMNFVRFLLYLM